MKKVGDPVPSAYTSHNRLDGFRGREVVIFVLSRPPIHIPLNWGRDFKAGKTAMTNRCIFQCDRTLLDWKLLDRKISFPATLFLFC